MSFPEGSQEHRDTSAFLLSEKLVNPKREPDLKNFLDSLGKFKFLGYMVRELGYGSQMNNGLEETRLITLFLKDKEIIQKKLEEQAKKQPEKNLEEILKTILREQINVYKKEKKFNPSQIRREGGPQPSLAKDRIFKKSVEIDLGDENLEKEVFSLLTKKNEPEKKEEIERKIDELKESLKTKKETHEKLRKQAKKLHIQGMIEGLKQQLHQFPEHIPWWKPSQKTKKQELEERLAREKRILQRLQSIEPKEQLSFPTADKRVRFYRNQLAEIDEKERHLWPWQLFKRKELKEMRKKMQMRRDIAEKEERKK